MAKAPETFDKNETAILKALYEGPDLNWDSYGLANVLYPDANISSPEKLTAFNETREATDRLMARALVRYKEKHTGQNGLYYNGLKLTKKGDMAALNQRVTAAKTGLTDEERKAANAVIERLKDSK
jgi:hypothetical protein